MPAHMTSEYVPRTGVRMAGAWTSRWRHFCRREDPVRGPNGYPRPIVDHAEERKAALERYEQVRSY
jgi:deoxyribodipyrimidine photolyase